MGVKDFLDPSEFSDPKSALQFSQNAVRQAIRYDVFEGKTIFEAIVLTKPIFLVDAQIGAESDGFSQISSTEGRLAKFAFKGRIIDSPSPHDFLPDPCTMNAPADDKAKEHIIRVTNIHTTFISSDDYTKTNSTLPNVGDKVRVELVKNIHSYNLQFGKFLGIVSNLTGVEVPAQEQCLTARTIFGVGIAGGDVPPGEKPVGGPAPLNTNDPKNLPVAGTDIWGPPYHKKEGTVTKMTSAYAPRRSPFTGKWGHHGAMDFGAKRGTVLYSIYNGVIESVTNTCPDPDPCQRDACRVEVLHKDPAKDVYPAKITDEKTGVESPHPQAGQHRKSVRKCLSTHPDSTCRACGYGYGNYVQIKDDITGHCSYYGHMNNIYDGIVKGARVVIGQPVGTVGSSGSSTGPHLHMAIKAKCGSGKCGPTTGGTTTDKKEYSHCDPGPPTKTARIALGESAS